MKDYIAGSIDSREISPNFLDKDNKNLQNW
jgi:hypothetical protein